MVDKLYQEELTDLRIVSCGGVQFSVGYYNISKVIAGLGAVFKHFNVNEKDTIVFTMVKVGEACIRIFREEGMELDYEFKCLNTINFFDHWYLHEVWKEESLLGKTFI